LKKIGAASFTEFRLVSLKEIRDVGKVSLTSSLNVKFSTNSPKFKHMKWFFFFLAAFLITQLTLSEDKIYPCNKTEIIQIPEFPKRINDHLIDQYQNNGKVKMIINSFGQDQCLFKEFDCNLSNLQETKSASTLQKSNNRLKNYLRNFKQETNSDSESKVFVGMSEFYSSITGIELQTSALKTCHGLVVYNKSCGYISLSHLAIFNLSEHVASQLLDDFQKKCPLLKPGMFLLYSIGDENQYEYEKKRIHNLVCKIYENNLIEEVNVFFSNKIDGRDKYDHLWINLIKQNLIIKIKSISDVPGKQQNSWSINL